MNANGDERIDHDEFVKFFLVMLMGTLEQKMYIAFRCYDLDDDESISSEEVKIILKNIPITVEGRYGDSFPDENLNLSRNNYMLAQKQDEESINKFLGNLFVDQFSEGIYFDEFCALATQVTSELFLAVYDCIYQYIPCVKNFCIMRAHFKLFL